ncbi:MAG: hypothetical protein GY838_19205 [bacterium]|nr:hypothetical protein [bacterium]
MTQRSATDLARRLDRLLGGVRRRVLGAGLLAIVGLAGGAALAAAWAAGAEGWPPGWTLIGLAACLGTILGLVVARSLVAPLLRLRHRRDLVRSAEARGGHANLLVAAEESLRRPGRWARGGAVAAVLRGRMQEQALDRLASLSAVEVAPLPRRRPTALLAAGVAATAVLILVLAPAQLGRGLGRLARPWQGPPPVPTAGIYGLPTDGFVVAGDSAVLQALDLARDPGATTVCEIRRGRGLWSPVEAQLELDAAGRVGRRWRSVAAGVHEDFEWRFRRGEVVSPVRRLAVRDLPLVTALAARIEPPTYTGVPSRHLENLPARLEVPAGSTVELLGRTNHPVAGARLAESGGDTIDLTLGPEGIAGGLHLTHSRVFTVLLEDRWGLVNAAPLRYEIIASADREPAVALGRTDDDGLLPLAGALDLFLEAADDYGVSGVVLVWRLATSREGGRPARGGWQELALPTAGGAGRVAAALGGELGWRVSASPGDDPPLQRRLDLALDTDTLELVPGDVLELAAVARDNRLPLPHGEARSRVLRLLVPSAGEVLARQAETTEEKQGELAEMKNREQELAADLDRLSRELMKNPVPDWGRQQEMEEAIRRQQRLREELDRVAGELRRELDRLARSQLTSPEQLRRAEELAELLNLPTSEHLRDLLERLEKGEDRPQAGDVSRALQEAQRRQTDMSRRLEAALAAMERIAREQEMEGMTALLEQLMRKQQELADQSRRLAQSEAEDRAESQDAADSEQGRESGAEEEQSGEPREGEPSGEDDPAGQPSAEELARRQEALSRELEQLQEQLAQTIQEMQEQAQQGEQSETEQQRQEDLQQALEKLQEQLAEGDMQEAAEQLAQMSPEQAAALQEQALNDMGSLYHVLLQTQQAMQMSLEMNQAVSLRRLAADLLAVSERQEEIAAAVPTRLRDVRSLNLTRSQHRLQKATARVRAELAGLMEEAPNRIVKQLEKLDELIEEMGRAVGALEQNRAAAARRHSGLSLALTNRAVIGLLTEAQATSSSSSSGGGRQQSAAEQLQEMIRKQAELNGATEELRRMLANRGLSQETRAGMERLGQEQAELAQRLGDLATEGGQEDETAAGEAAGERILGDMDRLSQDMETIAEDLGGGLVDDDTVARQVRILGRMLDARNSVRRRDYSTRRESLTAERLYGDPEAGLRRDPADERAPARLLYQPLDRAPLEYRDLVRRYFAALDSLRRTVPVPPAEGDLP